MWPLLAMAGIKLIGAGLSMDAAQRRASGMRAETIEQLRRLRRQQNSVLGNAEALAAASGVDYAGDNLQAVLADMDAEQKRQAAWMEETGMKAATETDRAATWKYVSDLGSNFFSFGSNMGWFK